MDAVAAYFFCYLDERSCTRLLESKKPRNHLQGLLLPGCDTVYRREELEQTRRTTDVRAPMPLPADRLWTITEAAVFFGMGQGWVRAHVPAVLLPGQGERRAVRYLPQTCHQFALRFQTMTLDEKHEGAA